MKKLEKKTITFATEAFDEEQGIFEGHGAVFGNVDDGGDVIEPGAFTRTIAENMANGRVKILALHNDALLPIGKPIELREDAQGLYIKARISDTVMGRDVKTLIKDGVLSELSIGYDPVAFEYGQDGIRHLQEVDLWEISVVSWAMNAEATIIDYKGLDKKDVGIADLKKARDVINGLIQGFEKKDSEKKRVNPLLKSVKNINGGKRK